MAVLTYYCDNNGHLVCRPYTVHNLHDMAEKLKIHSSWFHTGEGIADTLVKKPHYKIALSRRGEFRKLCTTVTTEELKLITERKSIYDGKPTKTKR